MIEVYRSWGQVTDCFQKRSKTCPTDLHIEKLKQEHCLWSYENNSVEDIPDDVLVELVMLYLDINEIDLLFELFGYKKVKQAWIENVVAQGERYYNLNYFFAWYYFHVKQPRSYVKAMATRQLNKRLAV